MGNRDLDVRKWKNVSAIDWKCKPTMDVKQVNAYCRQINIISLKKCTALTKSDLRRVLTNLKPW